MTAGVPEGFHTVQPFLMVKKLDDYMAFLVNAFGGTIIDRVAVAAGKLVQLDPVLG